MPRKSVEFNAFELVFPILLLYSCINNYDELIEFIHDPLKYDKIIFNDEKDRSNYLTDIIQKSSIVNNYITTFRKLDLQKELDNENIKCIYISGKTNKHPIISELNKGYDRKETKSDIYIEYENKEIKGVSVKQNAKATKSNYSVQKMLSKENDKILTNIKKTFLKENGYTRSDKTKRDNMNKLFYNNNPYWQALKTEIEINKSVILQQLLKLLYCCNMKYDVYEYDGTTLKKLNIKIEDISSVVFEEYLQYYYDTKGNKRETAKLFYRLCVDKKIYRVEIRWKGDIYNASPQFQIHNECPINSSLKSS